MVCGGGGVSTGPREVNAEDGSSVLQQQSICRWLQGRKRNWLGDLHFPIYKMEHGMNTVEVYVKGPGNGRDF